MAFWLKKPEPEPQNELIIKAPNGDCLVKLPLITRVTVVDHSPGGKGLVIEKWHLEDVMLSVQDDGRTLKVFLK